ncbi:hypothetical protein BVRB_9g207140 [Beta vulgaris subsp. vulgaris]|nr:hypothetical protein BVRB_9g207140 [Beta vulgaris subsp. vulgaris]
MQFIYVLAGWEGSAADGRILRDALSRPNGLKVPRGCYYLVDAGYKNCEGFLAPYRGQRYHLQEWTNPPTKKEELFNMKHASARNSRDGAAPLYRKPMVHYDKLVEIYANDLAKGSKVKGPGDQSETEEDISTFNVDQGNVDESASQTRGTNTTPGTSKQSLKRKAGELDPLEIEFLQISKSITSLLEAEKESALAMKDIRKAFTHEINVHEETCDKRKSLFEVLCTLPGLSSDQVDCESHSFSWSRYRKNGPFSCYAR